MKEDSESITRQAEACGQVEPMGERVAGRWAAIEARFIAARGAVKDWMDTEGDNGRLVYAYQAPSWAAYEAAEADYLRAKAALESLLSLDAALSEPQR